MQYVQCQIGTMCDPSTGECVTASHTYHFLKDEKWVRYTIFGGLAFIIGFVLVCSCVGLIMCCCNTSNEHSPHVTNFVNNDNAMDDEIYDTRLRYNIGHRPKFNSKRKSNP